jgi:hypothetical protein
VGTVKKSIASCETCVFRNVRHVGDGEVGRRPRYFFDGRLGHVEAQLAQFAVNPWSPPEGIRPIHPPDQIADVWCDGGATDAGTR